MALFAGDIAAANAGGVISVKRTGVINTTGGLGAGAGVAAGAAGLGLTGAGVTGESRTAVVTVVIDAGAVSERSGGAVTGGAGIASRR